MAVNSAGLDLGKWEDCMRIYFATFLQHPPSSATLKQLRSSILTAISPLRLDYEVHRLRGKAIEGETVK